MKLTRMYRHGLSQGCWMTEDLRFAVMRRNSSRPRFGASLPQDLDWVVFSYDPDADDAMLKAAGILNQTFTTRREAIKRLEDALKLETS